MTQVPFFLSLVLGVGEGQCKTEADAGFGGCQPKKVGRVAPKKTAGLCCLPRPCQSCGGWGGQTVSHAEPLHNPVTWRGLCAQGICFRSDSPKVLTVPGVVPGSRGIEGWKTAWGRELTVNFL